MSWALCSAKEKQVIDAYINNGLSNKTNAYMEVYTNSSYDSARASASQFFAKPNINRALEERQEEIEAQSTVSLGWRLKTLQSVAEAGLGTYIDKYGNERKEGLGAVVSAVSEINKMTGGHAPTKVAETDADGNDKPTGIEIKVVGVKPNDESGDGSA